MLYEMLTNIDWLLWFDRVLCSVAVSIFLFVVIWVLPVLVNYFLGVAGVDLTMRQGVVMMLRFIMGLAGIFILGDVLGFASDVVFAVLGTVFGVGISWAIKDQVANTVAGFMIFLFQSYAVGDEIASASPRFKGVIQSFDLQFVEIKSTTTGQITRVPNQQMWIAVIDLNYRDPSYERQTGRDLTADLLIV
jgi:small-conductance mechanosensitive channel